MARCSAEPLLPGMEISVSSLLSVVDHLVYAAVVMDDGCRLVAEALGIPPSPGGQHPRWGTRNALLSLGPTVYLEVMGPDRSARDPLRPRPFGLDGTAGSATSRPRLVTWAARSGDLERVVAIARADGVDLGEVQAGSRERPDGSTLAWRMTDLATPRESGIVPFFIDWGDTPHPGAAAPGGCTLEDLRLFAPDAARVQRILERLGISAVVRDGAPAIEAVIRTPRGMVTLR